MKKIFTLILFFIFFQSNTYSEDMSGRCEIGSSLKSSIKKSEKAVKEVKSQNVDDLAEIISDKSLGLLKVELNEELLCAVNDNSIDWRVRYYLVAIGGGRSGKGRIRKHWAGLMAIVKDRKQHDKIRGVCAMALVEVAKDKEIKKELTEVVKSSDVPAEVLTYAMSVIGTTGIDDADYLMNLVEYPAKNLNEASINFNAIRALGKSKDPKAFDYLVKVYDDSAPDSYFKGVVFQGLWSSVKDPDKREKVRSVMAPRLLQLLDGRDGHGSSRCEAANMLAYLGVKEAIEPIRRWFLPEVDLGKGLKECRKKTTSDINKITITIEEGNKYRECENEVKRLAKDPYKSGGNSMDVLEGCRALAKFGDKDSIPMLEKFIENFDKDSRWNKPQSLAKYKMRGIKFPEDSHDYKHLKLCLKSIKEGRVLTGIGDREGMPREQWLKLMAEDNNESDEE